MIHEMKTETEFKCGSWLVLPNMENTQMTHFGQPHYSILTISLALISGIHTIPRSWMLVTAFNQIHRVLCSMIECQGIIKLPWFGHKETQGITYVTYGAGSFEAENVFFCSAFYLLSLPLLSMTCIFHCMGFSCCCYIYTHLCTHLSTHIIVEMNGRNEYINYCKF